MQSSTTRDATRARDDGWAANVEIVAVDRDTPRRRGHRAAGGRATARWRRIGAKTTRDVFSRRRREAARARARGGGERREWREAARRALGLRHRDESAGGNESAMYGPGYDFRGLGKRNRAAFKEANDVASMRIARTRIARVIVPSARGGGDGGGRGRGRGGRRCE